MQKGIFIAFESVILAMTAMSAAVVHVYWVELLMSGVGIISLIVAVKQK